MQIVRRVWLTIALAAASVGSLGAETIALWNFNDSVPGVSGGALEFTVDRGEGSMGSNFMAANIGNLSGTTINGVDADPSGQALMLQAGAANANNGGDLTWWVKTEGYDSIRVSFATRRTSTGFDSNQLQYTLDSGATWSDFGSAYTPSTVFDLQAFDLSPIAGLNDILLAGFRIVFDGATTSTGNNRLDNLLVSGNPIPTATPIPEPATLFLLGLGLSGMALARKIAAMRQ